MKRALAVVLVTLSACTPPTKKTTQEDADREAALFMVVGVQDTAGLKVGQWASYTVRATGNPKSSAIRLSVVNSKDGKFWIENRTTVSQAGQTQILITKTLIDE